MKIGQGDVIDAALIGATVVGAASTLIHTVTEMALMRNRPPLVSHITRSVDRAIRIDLREQFGGVRYGKNYRPSYALVKNGDKHLIVKINDVGPLAPGRVIDLNERSMRYFNRLCR